VTDATSGSPQLDPDGPSTDEPLTTPVVAGASPAYDASAIQVLEGLEAVRKRPGMYIGSTGERGLHHLVWEVVDNSVDEALAGHCDRIVVTVLEDGGIEVVDDGRGIPVDVHPVEGIPAVTVVLTVLHAGGKFGGGGYKVSGGLHGVGVSVVNALSKRLEVEVRRDGYRWTQSFSYGVPNEELQRHEATEETGTTTRFWASEDIFETTHYDFETITNRFREMAFLNKGLEIVVRDRRPAAEGSEGGRAGAEVPLRPRARGLRRAPEPAPGPGAPDRHQLRGRGRGRQQLRVEPGGRDAVEHRLHRVGAHLREHDQHPRGRHP
jgi:DNA gyrase subunit B